MYIISFLNELFSYDNNFVPFFIQNNNNLFQLFFSIFWINKNDYSSHIVEFLNFINEIR